MRIPPILLAALCILIGLSLGIYYEKTHGLARLLLQQNSCERFAEQGLQV
jgi:hypothetical protein